MAKVIRMSIDERTEQLLGVAVKLASKKGVDNVTRRMVAAGAKCSEGLVSTYLGNRAEMARAITTRARKLKVDVSGPVKKAKKVAAKKVAAKKPRFAPKAPPALPQNEGEGNE